MAVEIVVADQVEIDIVRGVSYYEEFSVFENDGTEASPTQGDPLDLSDWPQIIVMADVIADQEIVRGLAAYVTTSPARFSVAINYIEHDKAFDDANNSRPLHVTVKAGNAAGTRERTLLRAIARVGESGY